MASVTGLGSFSIDVHFDEYHQYSSRIEFWQ